MALHLSQQFGAVIKAFRSCHLTNNVATVNLLRFPTPQVQSVRDTSFFNKRSSAMLWKSVTSVSNAGKRRGRGKNAMRRVNIYDKKHIGQGTVALQFPGLTAPIERGNTFLIQRQLNQEEESVTSMLLRSEQGKPERTQEIKKGNDTVERRFRDIVIDGWSSAKPDGKKLGPPDPVGSDTFEDFESWAVDVGKRVTMDSTLGRVRAFVVLCVSGNRNGTGGFAVAKGYTMEEAMNRAKNRTVRRLITFKRYEDRTILHDFWSQFGRARVIVKQMPPGHGLWCHRALKVCCEAFGIKDLYVKCEGSDNIRNIVNAFCLGLLRQKTHQEMADEKKLHLVRFRKEHQYFPEVVASPSTVRTEEEIPPNEIIDFNQYVLNGKVLYVTNQLPPFYTKLPSYQRHLRKRERLRDQEMVRFRLKSQYGELRSHLADEYPEAKEQRWRKAAKEEVEQG